MKTTLIITTYNWKEALKAVLESVKRQTVLPDEVIVADDGSREDTKATVDQMREGFPVPLIHSWHEDNGFQLSMSRNRAIAKASGDYLIMVDGDMVLSQTFIESHKRVAKPNWFVQGGRVLTDETCSRDIMENGLVPSVFSKGSATARTASQTHCYRTGSHTNATTIKQLAAVTWRFGDKMSSR